jgi:methyltransferase (TIGR00027 family)
MRTGRPSQTAQHNALFRALEQKLPQPLFVDPWARRFLRGRYRVVSWLPAKTVARAIDRRWPGPRAAVSVRTRYIDDAVRMRLGEGLDQMVILGAGFDARAYRLPELAALRVFEVDHPSTQAMKRDVVGKPPAHVTYVPLDFGAGRLEDALAAAGFQPDARTLFLWEGVTNYLDAESVDRTLRFIARTGRAVLFTYVDQAMIEGPGRFLGGTETVAWVEKLGEPFTFGLDPRGLANYLDERGLVLLEDFALSHLAARYYSRAPPQVSAYYHVVQARCRA